MNQVFIGKYAVTENGDIFLSNKKLKPFEDKDGYLRIQLVIDGKRKKFYIHRLVYLLFNGELNDGLVCCHLDGNNKNNHFSNIVQKTQKENIRDKIYHGTWQGGEKHPRHKYSDEDVLNVRDLLKNSDWTMRLIAKTLNLPKHFVFDVSRKKRKTSKEREEEAKL